MGLAIGALLLVPIAAGCGIRGDPPTMVSFEGTVYLGVAISSTRIESRDLNHVGAATDAFAPVRDGKVYALAGVSQNDAIVVFVNRDEPQLFIRRIGPPWTHVAPADVPGLCRYFREPLSACPPPRSTV